ncbi:ABC transporter ATP-binding protein [Nonomuraea soli]|uniref:ATP-binding cassette subfamily B protein n=1 Tax=Nonomuraea soli TaxID=1032476 RepID=A0A7W0CJE3_9ACTN|nr:ABC transporter ATP-binding protein [Nonomuraea soli]MBA2892266.1 ATP-binding cassette subfamily B protein [Nonomuraea soli]
MRAADRLVTRTLRQAGVWTMLLALASVVTSVALLALPHLIGKAVDTPGQSLWPVLAAVTAAALVGCDALAAWASGASGARAAAWVRRRAVRHVLGVGPRLTRRFTEGDLATRIGLNAEETGRAPDSIVSGLSLLIPSAGALVLLIVIDPWLAVALAAGLVVIALILKAFLRTSTDLAAGYQEAQAELAGRFLDAIKGARTIAAAHSEEREAGRILHVLPRLRTHAMGLWRANADAAVRAGLLVPLLEIVVLCMAGFRLAAGELSVGELYAAARYVVLGTALGSAVGQLAGLARARAAAARVTELLDEPATRYGRSELPPGPGTLEIRGTDGLDLAIMGGSCVAIVGRSGSGKSRLAELAGRMADPERGTVRLDGVPLPWLSRAALRGAVGYAWERPAMLGDTVAGTIALNGRKAPVIRSAEHAGADAFVRRLPEGYDTPLARAPMSGGERQRLGLARAFAQGERLLILDDATSSLDTVTEHQVRRALSRDSRTRLIVTHRVATAAAADRVIWLEDGRVRAEGPHERLWQDPRYRAVFA